MAGNIHRDPVGSNSKANNAQFPERENLLDNIAVVYFCATRGDSLEAQLVSVGKGRDVTNRNIGGLGLEERRGSL